MDIGYERAGTHTGTALWTKHAYKKISKLSAHIDKVVCNYRSFQFI